jgi:hypothetical protein
MPCAFDVGLREAGLKHDPETCAVDPSKAAGWFEQAAAKRPAGSARTEAQLREAARLAGNPALAEVLLASR